MDGSYAASPFDRLDIALSRARPPSVIEQLLRDGEISWSLHDYAEYAALRRSWPANLDLLPLPSTIPPGVASFRLVSGSSVATALRSHLGSGWWSWEVGPKGSHEPLSEKCLVEFRTMVAQFVAPTFSSLVFAAFVELLDNAAEHGVGEAPPVAAIDISGDRATLSVTDSGQGIVRSLRSNPEFRDIPNGAEALTIAIQDGTSSTAIPGRGNGFRPLFRALAERQARLRFRSADGAIAWMAQTPDRHHVPRRVLPERVGFHVRFDFPVGA